MSRVLPILFNTEMVRAILDGRKSCTRRLLKGPFTVHPNGYITKPRGNENLCPYEPPYQLGDILYVREAFYRDENCILYKADNDKLTGYRNMRGEDVSVKWHPSIHMPKEAARIWLKVTDVRVERLHEITVDGALREGAQGIRCNHVALDEHGCTDCMNTGWIEPPQVEFMQIWESTIKKSDLDRYGWDANPYVFVIEFERCEKPEGGKRWED